MLFPRVRQWTWAHFSRTSADTKTEIWLPNKTAAGGALAICVQCDSVATSFTVADDIGGTTYTTAVSLNANQMGAIILATNIAEGIRNITVTANSSVNFWQAGAIELYNVSTAAVASALDGTQTGTPGSSPITTGQITTTADGDFILQYAYNGPSGGLTSFGGGGGLWALLAANLGCVTFNPHVVQYQVQPVHGAITPSLAYIGSAGNWNTLAVAIKAGEGGRPLPDGIRVRGVQHHTWIDSELLAPGTSLALQFPCVGDLLVGEYVNGDETGVAALRRVEDGNGNVWRNAVSNFTGQGPAEIWYAESPKTSPSMLGPTLRFAADVTGFGSHGTFNIYDVVGAASSSAKGATAATNGNQTTNEDLNAGSITPQKPNSLLFQCGNVTSHTAAKITSSEDFYGDVYTMPIFDGSGTTYDADNMFGHAYSQDTSQKTFTWNIQHNDVSPVGVGTWNSAMAEFLPALPAGSRWRIAWPSRLGK